jgi:membrane-bound lytic murein transglycosylase B
VIRPFAIVLLLGPAIAPAAAGHYTDRPEVRAFVAEMAERHGFAPARLLEHFRRATPSRAVIKAITPPADPGLRSWQAYRSRFVESRRIDRGLEFWQRHAETLGAAEAAYGVPAEIIVAIIGIETYYGRHPGRFEVFNALTNLAFDYPPRAALFRGELEALLLLARDQGRDPWSYRGSYAGAIGLPQFLPSSIRRYAVDFDGEGGIDLAGSEQDAIGSIGRFLHDHGWQQGAVIALPARVDGDPAALLAEGIRPVRQPAALKALGIEADGAPDQPAALIDLATPGSATEYRLGFDNFFVLTRYNRSSFYAAAVMDLAAALRAGRGL